MQEDRPSLLLAPSQMDLLNASTQVDHGPILLPVTQSERPCSLPTQVDGSALTGWGYSGVTQMDDHPMQTDPAQTIRMHIGRTAPTPREVAAVIDRLRTE
jgi:hypothetical protein